jgi:hypothetical protein
VVVTVLFIASIFHDIKKVTSSQDDKFLVCRESLSRGWDDSLMAAEGLAGRESRVAMGRPDRATYSFGDAGVDVVQEVGSESLWPG